MAANLSATPNPVSMSFANVLHRTPGTARLTWNTGSTTKGVVHRLVDNKPVVGSVPGQPAGGAAKGTSGDVRILDGEVHTYVLLSVANPPVELARTELKTWKSDFVVWFTDPQRQTIFDLHVDVGPDAVRVRFHTRLPSFPWVTLTDPATGALAGLWMGSNIPRVDHDLQFGSTGAGLEQQRRYELRILADRFLPAGHAHNAVIETDVQTGTRNVGVHFDRVQMINDSDPGGSGELWFAFSAGEGGKASPRMDFYFQDRDFGDGGSRALFEAGVIWGAPREVWVKAIGRDDDGGTYLRAFDTTFEPGTWGLETANFAESAVADLVDVPLLPLPAGPADLQPQHRPFRLVTGTWALQFAVDGHLEVTNVPGATSYRRPGIGAGRIRPRPGVRTEVGPTYRVGDLLVGTGSGPGGVVGISARAVDGRERFREIEPPEELGAVVPGGLTLGDRPLLHLMASGADGSIRVAAVDPLGEEPVEWRELAVDLAEEPIAVQTTNTIAVVGRTSGGNVVVGDLVNETFRDIGPAPDGVLYAQWDGVADLVLTVTDYEDRVHLKLWQSYPEGPVEDWLVIGAVNQLLVGELDAPIAEDDLGRAVS